MKRIAAALSAMMVFSSSTTAQDWAKAKLEKSPRHGEWVKVEHGSRKVDSFVVYPEVKEKATAVVVIHEIFGLADWVKLMADDLAEAGYIAIAPDLLSGTGGKGGGTDELIKEKKDVRRMIRDLPADQITADLNACVEYIGKRPACNGKVVVCGFCWGGGQAFRFATNNKSIKAAFPFYGDSPTKEEDLARITCPVYGFYAENDARINSTVDVANDLMKKAGKTFEPVIYKGGGHGFMRVGETPEDKVEGKAKDSWPGNKKAREEAWKRWMELMKKV